MIKDGDVVAGTGRSCTNTASWIDRALGATNRRFC
jgi:hypothetical protein